jgi:hypothetical protein
MLLLHFSIEKLLVLVSNIRQRSRWRELKIKAPLWRSNEATASGDGVTSAPGMILITGDLLNASSRVDSRESDMSLGLTASE